jgi:4,5-DOPA dioxygenase extradiol
MKNKEMKDSISSGDGTEQMPVLFVGHGSPMNAIEENEFSLTWRDLGKSLPLPKAILCISAHWETRGTFITSMPMPPTIHDFGGFPKELYNVNYPAPGNPELALDVKHTISKTEVALDDKWGLDHGAWSVIKNIYPRANVPVIQLSLDYSKTPRSHYELAVELNSFRKKGVLIMGSGNMVHNLGRIAWDHANDAEYGFDWALHANVIFKRLILGNNISELINYRTLGSEVEMAVPTPDHYLPLLYALALKEEYEQISFFNDKAVMGSLTMTSLRFG